MHLCMQHSLAFISLFLFTALISNSNAQSSFMMQVNKQAPVYQANTIAIQATPEKVWAVLTNINHWTSWNPKITQAALTSSPTVGASFRWTVNGAKISSVIHTATPNTAFGWSGTTFGGSAIHNWTLEANGNTTVVHVEESMQGWLIGLFKKKMNTDLAADMQLWLEKLKAECEK